CHSPTTAVASSGCSKPGRYSLSEIRVPGLGGRSEQTKTRSALSPRVVVCTTDLPAATRVGKTIGTGLRSFYRRAGGLDERGGRHNRSHAAEEEGAVPAGARRTGDVAQPGCARETGCRQRLPGEQGQGEQPSGGKHLAQRAHAGQRVAQERGERHH